MPIYEYECQICHRRSEHLLLGSDEAPHKCEEPREGGAAGEACGGELVRVMSASAFHLQGGGWYKDGYASTKK